MKKTKRIACVLILMLLLGGGFAYASSLQSITVSPNTVTVKVNGQAIKADNFLYQGTTYVPLRAVSENLGIDVNWNQSNRTVLIGSHGENSAAGRAYFLLEGQYDALTSAALSVFYAFSRDESETITSIQNTKLLVGSVMLPDDLRQIFLNVNDAQAARLVKDYDSCIAILYSYMNDLEAIKKNESRPQLTAYEYEVYSENLIEIIGRIDENRTVCRNVVTDAMR